MAKQQIVNLCNVDEKAIEKLQSENYKLLNIYLSGGTRCASFVIYGEDAIVNSEVLHIRDSLPSSHTLLHNDLTLPSVVLSPDTVRLINIDNVAQKTSYEIYDDFDTPDNGNDDPHDDGIRAQLYTLASQYPDILDLLVLGKSHQDREIIALKLTDKKATGVKKGKALLVGLHHAREWVSTETLMRFLYDITRKYQADSDIQNLLKKAEVWILPVLNPDGYQYTFTSGMMWRKNMRDNNGNGQFDFETDGVDLNRNYGEFWGFDEQGASNIPGSWVYRGPDPFSEPETRALRDLIVKEHITHAISYHTYSNLILYPRGFLDNVIPPDYPLFRYLAGIPEKSAITDSSKQENYRPMLSADLYTTNGEFTDWAYGNLDVIAFTVELTNTDNGHLFPDDDKMLDQVYQDNLPFVMDIIKTAVNPTQPSSHIQSDPIQKLQHQPLQKSYGTSQEIEAFAASGSKVTLEYFADNDPILKSTRFYLTDQGRYFDRYIARIRRVEEKTNYRIKMKSGNDEMVIPQVGLYSYIVVKSDKKPILLVSAEMDQTTMGPKYLRYYTDAIEQAGYEGQYDLYIKGVGEVVDYHEVLSHYDLVVWFGGDNRYAFSVGQDREITRYLRQGQGNLFFTGQLANTTGGTSTSLMDYYNLDNLFYYSFGITSYLEDMAMSGGKEFPEIVGYPDSSIFNGKRFRLGHGSGAKNQRHVSFVMPTDDDQYSRLNATANGPKYTLASNSNQPSYHTISTKIEVPRKDAVKLYMDYYYTYWSSMHAVEIHNYTDDTWETIVPIEGAEEMPSEFVSDSLPANMMETIPQLKRYFNQDGTIKKDQEGVPYLHLLNYKMKFGQTVFDLSKYQGKTIEIYFSAILFGGNNFGNGKAFFQSMALETRDNILTPLTLSDGWKKVGLDHNLGGVSVMTDNTVFFTFGLEGVDTRQNRADIMKNVVEYLLR